MGKGINRRDSLRKKISALPDVPGVYELLDRTGRVLYVGKAKSLPRRLRYYLNPGSWGPNKVQALALKFADFRVTPTASEGEALDLEIDLIIERRPPYNSYAPHAPARVRRPEEPTLRVQVMEHIRGRIRRGDLRPGDRLPKYGRLAEHLGVSPSTVEWAYWGLQSIGLATRIPRVAWVVTADALERVNENRRHVGV